MPPGLVKLWAVSRCIMQSFGIAGINDNWKLAQYEIDELKERFVQATEIETTRPEVKMIPMMYPSIDSINDAISRKI